MSTPPDPLTAVRPAIAALPDSGIVELVKYGGDRPGLIPLWVGEGDQPTPEFICRAALRALEAGQTFYTRQRGIPPLRQALAGYLTRLHGRAIDEERVYVVGAGMQAIMLSLQAILDAGEEVVVPSPAWPNIAAAVQILGGVVRPVPLDFSDNGWSCDLEQLLAACGPRTKALVLNSPGNPTGWVMTAEEVRRVLDFARARGLWVVADEVYNRMVYDADSAPSFLSAATPEDRVLAVNSFSKNWAMTGWRMGWITAPPALGQIFENLVQYNTSGVATFLQPAAAAALEEGEPTVRALRERCRQGRDLVCRRMAGWPRVRLAPPAGAFYLFFAVEGEDDSMALAKRLVDQANVGLAPGSAFGPGGERFLCLCFACSPERLSEALDRLEPVLGA